MGESSGRGRCARDSGTQLVSGTVQKESIEGLRNNKTLDGTKG